MKINSSIGILLCAILLVGCSSKPQIILPGNSEQTPANNISSGQPGTSNPKVKPIAQTSEEEVANVLKTMNQENPNSFKLTPLSELSPDKVAAITRTNDGLVDYDKTKFDNLLGNYQIALFFAGKDCQACRTLEKTINDQEIFLPGGIVVFKAEIDKEAELVKKYSGRAGLMIVFKPDGSVFSSVDVASLESVAFSLRKVMEL